MKRPGGNEAGALGNKVIKMQKPSVIHPKFETFPPELKSQNHWGICRSRGSTNAGNRTRQVTRSTDRATTLADLFIPADAKRLGRLYEAHGVEIGPETQVGAAQGIAAGSGSVGTVTPQVMPTTGSP
jgi:hypothetical protein